MTSISDFHTSHSTATAAPDTPPVHDGPVGCRDSSDRPPANGQISRAAFLSLSDVNESPLLLAPEERSLRLPTFVEGTRIPLADGQTWSLPRRRSDRADPEFDEMLRAILEAEDESDRLRSELALTIFLLARNYQLTPVIYRQLLDFRSHGSLREMQRAVRTLAVEQINSLPRPEAVPSD